MSKKWLIILGGILIFFGVVQILSYLLGLNIWGILFAIALILIGLLIILRPKIGIALQPTRLHPFGDFNRSGTWTVQDERVWMLVGDNHLDFSQAVFPPGEASIQIYGLVGELAVTLSEDTGLSLSSFGLLTESKIRNSKSSTFFTPLTYTSDNFQTSPNKVRLEAGFLVLDLTVDWAA
jgi:lia operon protein LiaF